MTPARLPRSLLYVPANRPELFAKALARGADAIILDLEDAVPAAEKAAARRTAAQWLAARGADARGAGVYVRINGGPTGIADAAALPLDAIRGIRVPKCEDAAALNAVCKVLEQREREAGLASGSLELQAGIECAKGLMNLEALAACCRRPVRFSFGAADFVRDIAGQATPGREETLFARSYLVAKSRALGLPPPIAQVHSNIDDLDGLLATCRADRALGFFGRPCIHPKQVAAVNEAFGPSQADIARATEIVDAYRRAVERGQGALRLADGTFVDAVGFRRAQEFLATIAER